MGILADVIALCFIMADVIAIMLCGRWHHILYYVCGRCYTHFINWLMLLPWWQMEFATYMWADVFALYYRWNSHL